MKLPIQSPGGTWFANYSAIFSSKQLIFVRNISPWPAWRRRADWTSGASCRCPWCAASLSLGGSGASSSPEHGHVTCSLIDIPHARHDGHGNGVFSHSWTLLRCRILERTSNSLNDSFPSIFLSAKENISSICFLKISNYENGLKINLCTLPHPRLALADSSWCDESLTSWWNVCAACTSWLENRLGMALSRTAARCEEGVKHSNVI